MFSDIFDILKQLLQAFIFAFGTLTDFLTYLKELMHFSKLVKKVAIFLLCKVLLVF